MKALLSQVSQQLRLARRDPAYLFTTLLLPAGLYWFFAVPESGNDYAANYMIGSFSAFAYFGVIFLQYSINTAQEKSSAWSKYLSTLPISPTLWLFSRLVTSVILGTLACFFIYLVGRLYTPTTLDGLTFIHMLGLLTLGGLPFLLMGLVIGELFSAKAVVPVSNFFHLVLSFAGGLWKPPEILPDALQPITPWLPTYHYGKLAWSLSSDEIQITFYNITYLLSFTVVMGLIWVLIKRRS